MKRPEVQAAALFLLALVAACNQSSNGLGSGQPGSNEGDAALPGQGLPIGDAGPGGTQNPSGPLCAVQACSGTKADFCCPANCKATNDVDCPGCGNGFLEAGETCDPPSSCAQACPSIACQKRRLKGGGTCSALCVDDGLVTMCIDKDGCCPAGCSQSSDSDCPATCEGGPDAGACGDAGPSGPRCGDEKDGICPPGCGPSLDKDCATCGNGKMDPGETCDGAAACEKVKSTCIANGGVASGDVNTCAINCTECGAKDGKCPSAACKYPKDPDCAGCGNGKIDEAGETCDPPSDCETKQKTCVAQGGTSSGSTAACTYVCMSATGPSCGNGKKEEGETCDPPSDCMAKQKTCLDAGGATKGSAAGCTFECVECGAADGQCPSAACKYPKDPDCAGCGNTKIEGDETCDPPSSCENGQRLCLEAGGAASGGTTTCNFVCTECGPKDGKCPSTSCTFAKDPDCPGCGDGKVAEPAEQCDPPSDCDAKRKACSDAGGTPGGDSKTCTFSCLSCGPSDGVCPSAACTFAKDPDCPGCGNSKKETGETCDPPSDCEAQQKTCASQGGTSSGSTAACTYVCTPPNGPVCGNSKKETGETCDPPSDCEAIQKKCLDAGGAGKGSTAACTFECTECGADDKVCPSRTCTYPKDPDCAGCGNGKIESGETCDPPSMCEANQKKCLDAAGAPLKSTGDTKTCTFECIYKENGDRCGGGSECKAGSCVDGICCGSKECGECQTCSTGACAAVKGGEDDTCNDTKTCNADGKCVDATFIDIVPIDRSSTFYFDANHTSNTYEVVAKDKTTGKIAISLTGPFNSRTTACEPIGPNSKATCQFTVNYNTKGGAANGTLTVSASPGGTVTKPLQPTAIIIKDPGLISTPEILQ